MKLYDMRHAPNARRVRWFAAEKGIALDLSPIDVAAGENLSPDYLAVNPRGVVPTLVLPSGETVDESIAICRYLEALHPEPNLFGAGPLEMARVEQWQRRSEFDGLFNVAAAFRNRDPNYAERAMPGALPPTPAIPALAERGQLLAEHWLKALNARLAGSAYVAAGRFTVADITAAVVLDMAKWIGLRPTAESHPNVSRWMRLVKERPGYRA